MPIYGYGTQGSSTGTVSNNPQNTQQWAISFINYLAQKYGGDPATGANDPRVKFLMAWAQVEATFSKGWKNPLDTSEPAAGSTPQNSDNIQSFLNWESSYEATDKTLAQQFDMPIFKGLLSSKSTVTSLTKNLAQSNWSGSGAGSGEESGYASTIGSIAQGSPINIASTGGQAGGGDIVLTSATLQGSNYIGPGAWLVTLDGLIGVNAGPAGVGGLLGALNPASDVQYATGAAQLILARGLFAVISLGLIGVGAVMLFGKGVVTGSPLGKLVGGGTAAGTGTQIAQLANQRSAQAQSAALARQRAADAAASQRLREKQANAERRHANALTLVEAKSRAQAEETARVARRSAQRIKLEQSRTEGARHRASGARARTRAEAIKAEKQRQKVS